MKKKKESNLLQDLFKLKRLSDDHENFSDLDRSLSQGALNIGNKVLENSLPGALMNLFKKDGALGKRLDRFKKGGSLYDDSLFGTSGSGTAINLVTGSDSTLEGFGKLTGGLLAGPLIGKLLGKSGITSNLMTEGTKKAVDQSLGSAANSLVTKAALGLAATGAIAGTAFVGGAVAPSHGGDPESPEELDAAKQQRAIDKSNQLLANQGPSNQDVPLLNNPDDPRPPEEVMAEKVLSVGALSNDSKAKQLMDESLTMQETLTKSVVDGSSQGSQLMSEQVRGMQQQLLQLQQGEKGGLLQNFANAFPIIAGAIAGDPQKGMAIAQQASNNAAREKQFAVQQETVIRSKLFDMGINSDNFKAEHIGALNALATNNFNAELKAKESQAAIEKLAQSDEAKAEGFDFTTAEVTNIGMWSHLDTLNEDLISIEDAALVDQKEWGEAEHSTWKEVTTNIGSLADSLAVTGAVDDGALSVFRTKLSDLIEGSGSSLQARQFMKTQGMFVMQVVKMISGKQVTDKEFIRTYVTLMTDATTAPEMMAVSRRLRQQLIDSTYESLPQRSGEWTRAKKSELNDKRFQDTFERADPGSRLIQEDPKNNPGRWIWHKSDGSRQRLDQRRMENVSRQIPAQEQQ